MKRKEWPKGTWMKVNSQDTFKALIKQRGLSYRELGEMADCHASMIGQLASGHRTSCSPDLADRIARCLFVPRSVLFTERVSATTGHDDRGERIPA